MDVIDCWRFCGYYSLAEAAMLIIGIDPNELTKKEEWEAAISLQKANASYYSENGINIAEEEITMPEFSDHPDKWFPKYKIILKTLTRGIESGEIEVKIHYCFEHVFDQITEEYCDIETDEIDIQKTLLSFDDITKFLKTRKINSDFFSLKQTDKPGYLNPENQNYAPKLAAAVCAWEAVSADPKLASGRSVKQALLKWLRQHAHRFGLIGDDGKYNEQGVQEIAKISNWDIKGGAPKTPQK